MNSTNATDVICNENGRLEDTVQGEICVCDCGWWGSDCSYKQVPTLYNMVGGVLLSLGVLIYCSWRIWQTCGAQNEKSDRRIVLDPSSTVEEGAQKEKPLRPTPTLKEGDLGKTNDHTTSTKEPASPKKVDLEETNEQNFHKGFHKSLFGLSDFQIFIFRFIMLLFMLSPVVGLLITRPQRATDISFLMFYTIWCYIAECIYFALGTFLSFKVFQQNRAQTQPFGELEEEEEEGGGNQRVGFIDGWWGAKLGATHHVLNIICNSSALLVAVVFWTFLFPLAIIFGYFDRIADPWTIMVHFFNAIFLLLDYFYFTAYTHLPSDANYVQVWSASYFLSHTILQIHNERIGLAHCPSYPTMWMDWPYFLPLAIGWFLGTWWWQQRAFRRFTRFKNKKLAAREAAARENA